MNNQDTPAQNHIFGNRRPMTKPEFCQEFGIAPRTLNSWMASRIVPYYRIGGCVRFSHAEVVEALKRRRIAAKSEVEVS